MFSFLDYFENVYKYCGFLSTHVAYEYANRSLALCAALKLNLRQVQPQGCKTQKGSANKMKWNEMKYMLAGYLDSSFRAESSLCLRYGILALLSSAIVTQLMLSSLVLTVGVRVAYIYIYIHTHLYVHMYVCWRGIKSIRCPCAIQLLDDFLAKQQ